MSRPPHQRLSRKEKPAACPFCDSRVAKPKPFPELKDASGGRCQCGALFIADLTGKLGGEALMHALTLLADGDTERALGLSAGVDYELVKLGYRPRTHSLESWIPRRGAFGRPKLWFIRDLRD